MKLNFLIGLAIFLYPFNDIPILNFIGSYSKPISLFILSFIGFLLIFMRVKIDKTTIYIIYLLNIISFIDNFILLIKYNKFEIYSLIRSSIESAIWIFSYISIMHFFRTRKMLNSFFKIIILSYYIIFIITIIQKFFPKVWVYIYPLIHSGYAYDPFSYRLYSTFTEPSWFTSSLILLIIPITYSMILSGQFFIKNLLIWFSFISSVYLIIISTSRIGLISLILILIGGYISYIIFDNKFLNKKKILKLLLQGFTIIFISILFIQNKEFNTLTNLENNYSNITRLSCAIVGINIFKDFPWGVGFHNTYLYFEDKYLPNFLPVTPEVEMFIEKKRKGNTKNMYSRLLAETGIIGFLIFFGYIVFTYIKSLKNTNILFLKIYATLIFLSLLIIYTNTDSFMTTETLISIAILRFLALNKLNFLIKNSNKINIKV